MKEIITNRAQQFFINPKIAVAALILSVILLIWQLYLIISLYLFSKSDAANEFLRFEHTSQVELPDEFKLLPKLSNIDQFHLFGVIAISGGAMTMAQALKSSLPLILKGVMAYANPTYGHAIIKDDTGRERYYNIGDKISSNSGAVTLEFVFKDRVFIRNNGVLEYILYPKLDLSTKPTAAYSFPKAPVFNNNSINNEIRDGEIERDINQDQDSDHGFTAKQKARQALHAIKNKTAAKKARKLNSQAAEQTVNPNFNPEPSPELELKELKINTLSKQHWKSAAK